MNKRIIAGNWKMNGVSSSLEEAKRLSADNWDDDIKVVLCPPSTLISQMVDALNGSSVAVGGQDCHTLQSGAFTGDIAASMLTDLGCGYCIVGHSERRQYHAESNALVAEKASAALEAGLDAIICVGETLEEKDAGQTLSVLDRQIKESVPTGADADKIVIGYEPVWAIGTGRTPVLTEIEDAHKQIRKSLEEAGLSNAESVPIIYGGSVKPANASEILSSPEVNGALVGGASLKADDFLKIIHA